jgi:hypothetical protein
VGRLRERAQDIGFLMRFDDMTCTRAMNACSPANAGDSVSGTRAHAVAVLAS